ncbi:MAG TPA: hypothetical protein VIL48_04615 [Acidimicrobiales bacterium]
MSDRTAPSAPATSPASSTAGGATARVVRGGEPSEEEVAAIVAAIEAAWPRPAAPDRRRETTQRWRFSGRWWSKPVPLRRARPW